MKKELKIIFIVLGLIIVVGFIFYIIDYNRVSKNERPIFCIKNPAGNIADGGTIEYLGLGYKVIDFHTLEGYEEIKIGTWFMKYDNFNEEMKEYKNKFEEQLEDMSNINNEVTTIDIETAITTNESIKKSYTLNQEEIYQIFDIIDNLTFTKETCDGLPYYYIKYNSNNEKSFIIYGVEIYDNEYHITLMDKGEAVLSSSQKKQLEQIINKYFNK